MTETTAAGPVVVPSEYRILPTGYAESERVDKWMWAILVTWRGPDPDTGTDRWAIRDTFGRCLDRRGNWDHEPNPSSRTDEWKRRYRHSLDEAIQIAKDHVDSHVINLRTFEEINAEKPR